MKFLSSFPKVLILGLLFVGVTFAASGDLRDRMDNLSSDIPFGYATSQKISVNVANTSTVTISSPVIQDELSNTIKTYTVMYSQYPLSQILEDTTLLDQSKEKTFTFTTVTGIVYMSLDATTDTLDASKVYYISVIPKDTNGILGEISNEMRFKLSDRTSGEGIYTGGVHTAAGADMNLANVTHTISSKTVTLRWTAINGSDSVDIYLFDPTAGVYNKLSTVHMSDERYSFTISRNGEFIVKFMPNNSGREKVYTFTASGITGTTPTTTPITHVPHVGPTENILVALFIAFVLYLLYRRSTLHRK